MHFNNYHRISLFLAFACLTCMAAIHPRVVAAVIPRNIVKRDVGMSIAKLVEAVKNFLQDKDAFSPITPDKCAISFFTDNGGNCGGYVNCKEDDHLGDPMAEWSVCYLGGRQFFNHPLIGDYSITFTKAGGVDGDTTDGLHSPVLQLADYNNWEPFVLDDIMAAEGGAEHGRLCGLWSGDSGRELGWECGVPQKGSHSAFGMSLIDSDSTNTGYAPGWCTAHVNQYQKNEYGVGDRYAFDVILFDAKGAQIGHVQKASVDTNGYLSIDSRLPYTLDISVGAVDSDPVTFAYAGQLWVCDGDDTSAHDCTLGTGPEDGYENGDREGDMGFTCDAAAAPPPPPATSSLKGMFVGDSITQGADGDYTWRYRLWQWLSGEGVDVNFVGPYEGTFPSASPASARPSPPPLYGASPPPATPDPDAGRYAGGVEASFPRPHYSMWGRQAAQDYDKIQDYVQEYQPDYLFVLLGFNDLGWFVSGPEGTLESVQKLVQNAQTASPNIKVLVGNVVQRTLIKIVNEELPEKTTAYNNLLNDAIGSWATSTSVVKLVDVQSNYDCNPDACTDGYDGLHPNALGEYHIAQAFADVLRLEFNIGKNPFQVGAVPARVANTPTNFKAQEVPAGIYVSWNPEIGARGYDLRNRRVGGDWAQRYVNTNAYWETWVFDNDTWEYQVRTSMGDGDDDKSDWTDTASATAHPKTAPGPKNIKGQSTGSGISATWDAVTGYNVIEYELIVYDEDDPGAIIISVGTETTTATVSNLTPGHEYVVAVVTWTEDGGGFPNTGPNVTV